MLVFLMWGDGLGGFNFVTKAFWRASNFVTPQKSLKQKEKLIFFFTFVLRLNLDENFMGIAVLYFASLCLFFRWFFEVFKINFVTKSDKVQTYKKHQITNFFEENKIKREKYLKESMFLKFFDNFKNKHGILSQIFAAGVTKLLPPDEIRRFDGTWIADSTQIFQMSSLFFKFKLSSLSGILPTWSVLHAIIGFRRQICMRCSILYMQRILFKFENFVT